MANKRSAWMLSALAGGSMLLSACGADSTATPVAVAPTTTAGAAVAPTNTAGAAAAGGKIAILLPETKTARYESQDLPSFKAKLQSLGFDAANIIYNNANQDASAQRSQAEAALTNGAKVLVLD